LPTSPSRRTRRQRTPTTRLEPRHRNSLWEDRWAGFGQAGRYAGDSSVPLGRG
jgi:hypothetical protein